MPKFSVYTPTHDSRWLRDCYRSLQAQTVADWEWVILRNGDKPVDIPAEILSDSKVRVFDSSLKGIGALKGEAVRACSGDFFVELDHDDQLAANCLEEVYKAALKEPGGFYYSDFASVYPNGAPETFGSDWGWEDYIGIIDGQEYKCQRSFPPCPKSLSEIWFAPNHVRVWSRQAYEKAGGYDARLEVCDDHDLVCRTYLARVPFVHIAKPLYLYRRVVEPRESNTYVKKQELIQKLNYRNMNLYLHPMIDEWARREHLVKLDLGGAHNSPSGYISLDSEFPKTDLQKLREDITGPAPRWPDQIGGDVLTVLACLPDSSVGVVRAFDFIEHLPREAMIPFMNEVYRVLVPSGYLISGTPSSDGRGAFQDPTHTNYVNENSFWYYTDREFAKYLNGKVRCRFQIVRLWTECPTKWHEQHAIPYVYADLLALKGFKHIGPVSI